MRSYKKVGNIESTYQYLGDKLVYEKRGDIELEYGYNSFGDLAYIRYNTGETMEYYYIVCNSRGDVVDLYGGSGTLIVHYTYDSWGNVISITDKNGKEITSSTHIGIINPIRYRGYYYDAETGLYYLQSRYYNPQIGRFLNADGYISTGQGVLGYNMFAYCLNNPVNMSDPTGAGAIWNWIKEKIIILVKDIIVRISSYTNITAFDAVKKADVLQDVVGNGIDIGRAEYNYTKDVVNIGRGTPGYTPTPYRKFVGVTSERNNISVEDYKVQCITAYKYMVDFEFISKDESWEDIVASGKDQTLTELMISWDTGAYDAFNYNHECEQTKTLFEFSYKP